MKRLVGLVALALALSIFAGLGAIQIQNQADDRALKAFATVKVYLAQMDIPAKTSLQTALASGAIALEDVPAKILSKDAIRVISENLLNQVSQIQITEGQILYLSGFAPKPVTAPSVNRTALFAGMSAVSLEIPTQNRVGGYLLPGDLVTVLATAPDGNGRLNTKTLLSDIKILAIGAKAIKGLSVLDATNVSADLVTLSVPPSLVAELLTSAKAGTISLILTQTSGSGNSG